VAAITVTAACLPAFLAGAGTSDRARDILFLAPIAHLTVLLVAVVSATSTGGGRELLSREQAVAYPVSPTTDHLGALLMAPLSLAWMLQAWALLASTAYVVGPRPGLLLAQVPALGWLLTATTVGHCVAWGVEWVRRGPHGAWVVRGIATGVVVVTALLVVSDRLVPLLDRSPTRAVVAGSLAGATGDGSRLLGVCALLAVVSAAATVGGAVLARLVTRRPARDELRVEGSTREPRPNPGSDLTALLRVDRATVWRSVPLRRGLTVLSLFPGLVALGGALPWDTVVILPGLVASGGALLFGVNAWCLDGQGALWRDSLPARPLSGFGVRALAVAEVLLVASAATLVLASARAGAPLASEAAAVVCAAVVVTLQVVEASLRWSVRRPYAMDLRSARATPAPPAVMVGYSARLALVTTLTGLVFTVTARLDSWGWSVPVAMVFLAWSAWRLRRTAGQWADPVVRSRVLVTVTG
jgi:hypothetical protein